MHFRIKSTVVIIAIMSGFACQRAPIPATGYWSGTLAAADGNQINLRFFLEHADSGATAYFLVGDERTSIPRVLVQHDSVIFVLTGFSAEMRARWTGSELNGDYVRYRKDTTRIPFSASPEDPRSAPQRAPASPKYVPLIGSFQAYISEGSNTDSSTTALFSMRGDSVFGTLIAPDGDYGLLAGIQDGEYVQLHRFTGWQAFFVSLRRDGGHWEGKLYSRSSAAVRFTLEPRSTLPVSAGGPDTRAKFPGRPFVFTGVTSNGDTVRNSDQRFKGKALIVDVMGTWCHNCMDGAPLLEELHRTFGPQGVEVVALSFELKNDPVIGSANLRSYAARYGITFPLLFMGSTESANVDAKLKNQLDGFAAWPTTLFIDKKGKIRKIHVGFRGPGTGAEYQAQIQSFYHEAEALLK